MDNSKNTDKAFTVIVAPWSGYSDALSEIRKTVFIKEQGVSPEEEWDEADADQSSCTHLLAYLQSANNKTPRYVGTARILNSGKIGRVAVLKEYRNLGVGKRLVHAAIIAGLSHGFVKSEQHFFLSAQVSSIPFYENLGFETDGETFMEAGIAHKKMHSQNTAENRSILFGEYYQDTVNRLAAIDDFNIHMVQQASITQRNINILSKELRSDIYSDEDLVENISKIVRTNRQSKIRILIHSPVTHSAQHHRLIALAKRLPSRIEIKKIDRDIELNGEGYTIFDEQRITYFNDEDSLIGFANYEARAECKHFMENYNYLWTKRSSPDPDLRVLSL